ncbi:MAG TPA: hypothetical protein DCQ32_11910, partial [Cyanobacteria bacterium UBA8156]|nr:hypothetical protein [Cyanobacteria bacterium UBA8156]
MSGGGDKDWHDRGRSLRRLWLYGGAASLALHGWLLGQSWSIRLPAVSALPEEPPALELVAVEPPPPKQARPEPPPPELVPPKPVTTPAEPVPSPEVPVVAAPLPPVEAAPSAPMPTASMPPAPLPPTPTTATLPENPPQPPPEPVLPSVAALSEAAANAAADLLDRPTETKTEPAAVPQPPREAPRAASDTAMADSEPAERVAPNRESGEDFAQRMRRLMGSPAPKPTPPVAAAAPPAPGPETGGTAQCLRCDRPGYPADARARNLQGRARLAVDVAPSGMVTAVRLLQSSGHSELDEAAIRHAWNWQFTASANGRQNFRASVDFQIEGSAYQRQQRERPTPPTRVAAPPP